ncbi:MAG: DUF3604 domain-containing protein [Pseudomonadota bacterium]
MPPIPPDQMGDVWPQAQPGADGADYGQLRFEGPTRCIVRAFETFELIYTVGQYGLDDTGAIKLVTRWTADNGPVQFSEPGAPNYVTATASNGAHLALYAEPYPHQRPWYNGVRVTVERGFMRPGDTIRLVLGDRSGGGPGYRIQTFAEAAHTFKLLADPCATGVFLPVGEAEVEIVGGPVARWVVVAPTMRPPETPFAIGLRAEDIWGNATAPNLAGPALAGLRLEADGPVEGLPRAMPMAPGALAARIEGVRIAEEGVTRFTLRDGQGQVLARSNPHVTQAEAPSSYWGDLHGQSGETVGINPMADYLAFGRDVAFLDVMSHQANDFQITTAFWQEINAQSAAFDAPGRFVVFPGYEWSGNTPVGGDHNVIFRHEGAQIRRSSHALLSDRSDIATDAPVLTDLFEGLREEACVVLAHVGGRPADIAYAHDPRLRTGVEVHSDWGTFEWIMRDAFALGHRVGLLANSDGHKGAPGMCHPGASEFGAYSGLTCFRATDLSRDGIFDALRRRHHYATTGARLHLEVRADVGASGEVFAEDPAWSDLPATPGAQAAMGDIVRTEAARVRLAVACNAHAPVVRIDVMNGPRTVATWRPFDVTNLGARYRVIWQGAEYRGRGRQTRWRGHLRVDGATIARVSKINAWNHERPFAQDGAATVRFDVVTTGNFGGCDLWLSDASAQPDGLGGDGVLEIETDLVQARLPLQEIGLEDSVFDAGGLERQIRVCRLPNVLSVMDVAMTQDIARDPDRDNPLWVRVTTEDGAVAWSSPIYVIP